MQFEMILHAELCRIMDMQFSALASCQWFKGVLPSVLTRSNDMYAALHLQQS